jgi:hypothetical protein
MGLVMSPFQGLKSRGFVTTGLHPVVIYFALSGLVMELHPADRYFDLSGFSESKTQIEASV